MPSGTSWKQLRDEAYAKGLEDGKASKIIISDEMIETARFTLSGICGFAISKDAIRKTLESVINAS